MSTVDRKKAVGPESFIIQLINKYFLSALYVPSISDSIVMKADLNKYTTSQITENLVLNFININDNLNAQVNFTYKKNINRGCLVLGL